MSSITSPVSVTAPGFNGVSKFASSLQQVLTRAVGIASLPLDSLEAGLTDLTNKQTALLGVDNAFSSLQSSIAAIQTTITSGLLNSSVSDGSIATVNVGKTATAGTYTLEVDNLGSSSTALSVAGATSITDPATQGLSTAASVTLTVGSSSTTVTPASGSLQDLEKAINSTAGSQVQATLVNVGSTSAPDYRLSLSSVNLGTDAITLTDSAGTNLVASSANGALASYQVDGNPVTSTSRTVTLSPGLTATLAAQSTAGQPVTITVSNNASSLASAFNSFATAYNAAANAVSAQRGQSAGALDGDSLLAGLTSVLGQLATYSNGSSASALANYGITVDSTGQLSVDTSAFTTAATTNFQGLLSTLGGATTGGFLQTATNLLSSVETPTTGTVKTDEASIAGEITAQQALITAQQATVSQLQTNLTAQIAAADTAIAGWKIRSVS